jgi:integrase
MKKTKEQSGFLFKRRGSPFYYARWWIKGEEHVKSTEKKSKPEAEQEKARLVALSKGEYSTEDAFRVLLDTLACVEDLVEREKLRRGLAKRLTSGAKDKLALANGWEAWLENPNKARTPKHRTLLGYEAIWKRFAAWAKEKGLEYFHEVDRTRADEYAGNLWKSHVSPSTFNAHVKLLTNVFKLLETQANLTENVWAGITRKTKTPDQGRRNLSEDELRTVLERATGNLRLMFALSLFTGLRLGDVVNLRWDEIDNDRYNKNVQKHGSKPGFIIVKPMKTSHQGKLVQLPVHPALRQLIETHRAKASGEFLFPRERQLHAENAGNITSQIQAFFESCGIQTTEKSENGERRRAIVRVGFHSLRHSFVSMCAKVGTPLHVVQKLVGHGSPLLTSDVYTHLDDEQQRQAVAPLPDLGLRVK